MTLTERSRRRVAQTLSRLETTYGRFETVEKTWKFAPDAYDRIVERFEAGTVGGAGVWITNDAGEVLLVKEDGVDSWSEPAGKQEPGESLLEAARREVSEEAGVECDVTGLALVQVVEIRNESEPDRPGIFRVIATFEGRYESGTVRPQEGEIATVRWWGERPDDLRYDELERLPIPAAD